MRTSGVLVGARRRLAPILGVVLMGAGLIGLPSVPDDLARWPGVLSGLGSLIVDLSRAMEPFSGIGVRWLVFVVGVVIFWRSMHASIARNAGLVGHRPIETLPPAAPTATVSTHASRQPSGLTIPQLVELLRGKTSLEMDRIARDYRDRWFRFSGVIFDVDHEQDAIRVRFGMNAQAPCDLDAVFRDPEEVDRIRARSQANQVNIAGRLASIRRSTTQPEWPHITLEDAVLD
jgi:hypothetical protein